MTAYPRSKGRTGCANARRSSLGRTGWRAANIRCLRFFPTPSTRRERASASKLSSPAMGTARWKWRTLGAASRWTIIPKRRSSTGSWFSASCTREASTTIWTRKAMNSLWASMAWACAPPSILPSIWTWKSTGTAQSIPCISSAEKTWAGFTRNRRLPVIPPGPEFVGARTCRCLPTLRSLSNTTRIF